MAEENDQNNQQQEDAGQNEQKPQGDGTDWKAEARKWEARAKASNEKLKGLDELKAKADKLDELENANKSELERISEQAAQAQSTADEWRAKFEELEAQRQHEINVRQAATTYGVDTDVLMRMSGDVEENAKFLQAREAARPKFGSMRDGGEQPSQGKTLEEIRKIRNPTERVRARAEYIKNHPNN